jgi:hypothetical protein
MPRARLLALATACCIAASCDRPSATPSEPTVLAQTPDAVLPSATSDLLAPGVYPPQAWVDNPAELGPEVPQSASNCDLVTFPFPPSVDVYRHPNAVCREREWGSSGIVRQQGHDIHVASLPKCNGLPGDIKEIRLCKVGWALQQTPWGKAGPLGCIGVTVTPTCET